MAHDPFRGATRRPKATVAAETPQNAFSGPLAGLTPDPPAVAPGAQEGPVSLDTPLTDAATAEFKSALEREMAALNDAKAQARGYPCRLSSCGQVLASPGALGGHMAAHRRRGELD